MEWHNLKLIGGGASDEISAEVAMMPDSSWFSGHFPDTPILPGIAILTMIFEAIQRTTSEKLGISGLKKIRFKKVLGPNDRLAIKIIKSDRDPLLYSFIVTCGHEIACSGTLQTRLLDEFSEKS